MRLLKFGSLMLAAGLVLAPWQARLSAPKTTDWSSL